MKRSGIAAVAWMSLLAASMVMVSGLESASAQEAPAVLYSYEKFVLGNDVQYVLVPRPSRTKVNVAAPQSVALINGLFNELRSRKSATYGSTTLDLSPAGLKKGQATVKVDQSKSKYFVIIAAEVVHTLDRLGIRSVSFPGFGKKAMTRADIGFGVFDLHIPAWRALPPVRIEPAVVELPTGPSMSSSDFYGLIGRKDPTMKSMIELYFKSDDRSIVLASLRALPLMKLEGWTSLLLPLLKHKDKTVRVAALEALSGQEGDDVLAAIGTVMDKDKDKDVARKAADVLGNSKNKKYAVFALYFQMREGDEKAAVAAIDKIIKMKEPSAVQEMTRTARTAKEPVALKSIEALGSLGAVAELQGLFEDKKVDMARRLAAAGEVRKLKDEGARFKALGFVAVEGAVDDAKSAIDDLARIKDPLPRPVIEKALTHKESAVRQHAGEVLATQIKDPASLKALANAASANAADEDALQTSASKIMATLTLNDVLTYTTNRNIVLKRVAYEALGSKVKGGNKRVFDVLAKGLGDKDAGIRAASAKAIVAFKDDKALAALIKAGDDKEAKVRRFVATGLGQWDAGKVTGRDLLLKFLADSDALVASAAVASLRKRKEFEAYPEILKLYKGDPHPDPRVRAEALRGIHELAPDKEKPRVISVLSGGIFDKDHDVKILAIDLLGNYDNAAAVTGLASLINDPTEEYRIASLAALGKTKSSDAVELIVSVINDPKKPVRLAAIEALGVNGKPVAAAALKKHMKVEKDVEVLQAVQKALKKIK